MAIYAVGDIQGCLASLQDLLNQVGFDPAKDKLWCAGDLVNRGPASLETLRFIRSLGDSAVVVLGNHDLHLLALGYGVKDAQKDRSLHAILNADDKQELLAWLRHQPLLHYDAELAYAMVHAGFPAIWSFAEALGYAKEVETVLRGSHYKTFLEQMYGNKPDRWDKRLAGWPRLRVITNYLTRMRICNTKGQLKLSFKGSLDDIPTGYQPWFKHHDPELAGIDLIVGHWAALNGRCYHPKVHALDTGCVWGGRLTMMRLSDQARYTCDCSQYSGL